MATPAAPHDGRVNSSGDYADRNRHLARLIEQARGGSLLAFEELYNATVRWLIAQVRLLVNNEQAEDILTDVYLQVWRSLEAFDPERSPPTVWLRMIVRSRALDYLRRERVRQEVPLTEQIQSSMQVEDGPDHLVARSQERRLVHASLSGAPLTSRERVLLGLAYFHENTHQEISAMTGLSLGTVRTTLARAREKLRAQLGTGVPHMIDGRQARQGASS